MTRLRLILLLSFLLLGACSRVPEREQPSPPAGAGSSPVGTPTPQASPEIVAPTTTPAPTPVPTSSSGVGNEAPYGSDKIPPLNLPLASETCGLLLPHQIADPVIPVDDLSAAAIPDDLVPEAAIPAWQRLLGSPETVGMAAFEVGREAEGLYFNADVPMPLASVVKVIHLVAYAEAAAAGRLDPAEWLPLSELDQYYLPGSDLRAHSNALRELREANLVAYEPPATPVEQVPWMMIRHSSNAASDYLHMTLGQRTIEETVLALGLNTHTAPCPFLGQFLVMSSHARPGDDRRAVQGYIEQPDVYGQDVMRLVAAYANDESFRLAERSPRWQRPSLQTQALFSDNLNAQGTAREYATLMARLLGNGLSSSYANIVARRAMEWPMEFPANQALFSTIGYKNGSLPGVLSTVYYARRLEDGAGVVVALFYRRLPDATYRTWRQALPHDELARWLLADPEAIPILRAALSG